MPLLSQGTILFRRVGKDMEGLTEFHYPMNMQEAVGALFEGKMLLIKGLEQSRHNDVLVRLDLESIVPVTQISYDVVPPDGYWRKPYWVVYDLPMNVLSTYPCYVYEENMLNAIPQYGIGDSVRYISKEDSSEDSALVTAIYHDTEYNWFYKLTRDQEIYAENELKKDRLA